MVRKDKRKAKFTRNCYNCKYCQTCKDKKLYNDKYHCEKFKFMTTLKSI